MPAPTPHELITQAVLDTYAKARQAVLDRFTKPLYVAARVQGDYTDITDTRRGRTFQVKVGPHVFTVTVELTDFIAD